MLSVRTYNRMNIDITKNPYFNRTVTPSVEAASPQKFETVEPTKKGLTSIIIPAFFNDYPIFHATGNCIGSVREHTNKLKTPYEIILVINGNTGIGWLDQEAKKWNGNEVKEAHVDKIIPNQENLGYAKAVNQAIRCSSGENLVFLNNDAMVFDHWLEDMQEALLHVDMVEATPMYGNPWARQVEAQEYREASFSKYWLKQMKEKDPALYPFLTDFTKLSPEEMKQPASIEDTFTTFRDFSCVITRRELLKRIGVFNEEFFMYAEDIDLVRRIEKVGGKVVATARTRTFHIVSGTAWKEERTPQIMNESKEKLKEIWGE